MSRPAITFRLALAAIARVLDEGARTHSGDWRDESASFHTGRAERHLRLLRETDTAEDHLANATCRLLMALELRERAAEARKLMRQGSAGKPPKTPDAEAARTPDPK
jgi:hypothetical protein